MKMVTAFRYPMLVGLSGLIAACANEATVARPEARATDAKPVAEARSVQQVRAILRFKPSSSSPQQLLAQVAQAVNISAEYVQGMSGGEHVVVLSFPSSRTTEEVLAAVRSQSSVDYVEPDKRRRAQ